MGRPLKIAKDYTQASIIVDQGFPNNGQTNNGFDGDFPGVVGGNNVSLNILVRAKIGSNSEGNGYILRQKGKRKFLVRVGSDIGVCSLVDEADGDLSNDQMTITATDNSSTNFRLSTITNHWGLDYSGNKYLLSFFSTADAGDIPGTPFPEASVENND
jgi:hypothetical protein